LKKGWLKQPRGKAGDLLVLARKLHELPLKKRVQRVCTTIQLDDRRDKKASLGDKIKSIRGKMR